MSDLARLAARVDNASVTGLMLAMSRKGRAASRKGDTESVAQFEAAFKVYQAEAIKRGLVTLADLKDPSIGYAPSRFPHIADPWKGGVK